MPSRLDLVPIFMADRLDLADELVHRLGEALGMEVARRDPGFDPEIAFDPSRSQYNSTLLLRHLLDTAHDASDFVLGVTSVDLFVPVLTYVFGEAQLDGKVAVVSLNRLAPDKYGLPADEGLLFDRLLKESIHEIGHCLGLLHCMNPGCVMRSSTYAEEVDLKHALFCAACSELVAARR